MTATPKTKEQFVTLPVEPTEAMLKAGWNELNESRVCGPWDIAENTDAVECIYRAMVAASLSTD